MAINEAWTLDSVALTSGNFDVLELAADPPKARMDVVTAADSEAGALMRQPLHENRAITFKVRVTAQASMNAALDQIGVIRDKLRLASATPDGIALTWTPANSTRTVTFDVLGGEIPEMPIGLSDHAWSWFRQRPIFTIELTCKPYWRAAEVTTSTASSSTPITTLEVPSVPGDIPALGRLIVTDTATQIRRHVEWGLENQFYNSGTSLLVDSDNMVVSGFAGTQTTRTGAYDPNASGNSIITSTGFGVRRPVAIAGTGNLAHVGTFRVKGRFYGDTVATYARLSYRVGDGPYISNSWVPVMPGLSPGLYEIDLGPITIPTARSGTQQWDGRIEVYSTTGAGIVDVDYLLLVPAAEGYGKAKAPYSYQPGVLVARDDVESIGAGALNARVAPLGGTWTTSGATTDFQGSIALSLLGGTRAVARETSGDAGLGRLAILGSTNYTNTEVGVWVYMSNATGIQPGVIARHVDASNYVYAEWLPSGLFQMYVRIAGVLTGLNSRYAPRASAVFWALRIVVFTSGRAIATLTDANGNPVVSISGYHSSLATGGALATGKPGFLDYSTSGITNARYYDDFWAATPPAEPLVINSSRTLEVRHNDTIRQDSAGAVYGRPPTYLGSRFLVPPGTSRVAVKARRTDADVATVDNVTDATQIQVAYQPRGLVVPR